MALVDCTLKKKLFLRLPSRNEIQLKSTSTSDLGKPQKKYYLSGPATMAFSPPPPRLGGHRNFFPYIKKSSFFLSGTTVYPTPPLSGPATKKITFLCGFPEKPQTTYGSALFRKHNKKVIQKVYIT